MTAIQVRNDNLVEIMNLPCVKSCVKQKNNRYEFILLSDVSAEEGDWIINPESELDWFVMSDRRFKEAGKAWQEVNFPKGATNTKWKIKKRKDDQSLDDWIKSMVGDDKNLYELLHVVSVESYITGTRISNNEQAVF